MGPAARGSVLLFRSPLDGHTIYIKRVVARGGDTVAMRAGVLWRNGYRQLSVTDHTAGVSQFSDAADLIWQAPFETSVDTMSAPERPTAENWGPLVVPAKHNFLLGDNRAHSRDSRHMGFISDSLLVRRARVVLWGHGP